MCLLAWSAANIHTFYICLLLLIVGVDVISLEMKLQRAKAKQSQHSHRICEFRNAKFRFVEFEVCDVGKRKCETPANGQTFISLWRFTLAPLQPQTNRKQLHLQLTHLHSIQCHSSGSTLPAPHACKMRTQNSQLHTIFVLIKFELLPAINVAKYIHSNPVQINIYLSTFYDLLCRCAALFSWLLPPPSILWRTQLLL